MERRVRAAQGTVSEVRGLPFLRDVAIQLETPTELRAHLEVEARRELDVDVLAGTEAFWKLLNLAPPEFVLLDTWLAILEENVGGYYDPIGRRLVLIDQGPPVSPDHAVAADALEGMVITHELVHALQDQNFDLRKRETGPRPDSDVALAQQALVEGDASYAMLFALIPDLNPDNYPIEGLVAAIGASGGPSAEMGGLMGDAPRVLTQPLVFPYLSGLGFVHNLRSEIGSFRPVDQAFADPPLSTEHILHPQKFRDRTDPPIRIDLKGTHRWFPAGRLLSEDTVGEFTLRLVLEHHQTQGPDEVAAGWGGDRLWVFDDAGEKRAVWWTTWDTSEDAAAFAAAFAEIGLEHPWIAVERSGQDVILWISVPETDRDRIRPLLAEGQRTRALTFKDVTRRRPPRAANGRSGG